MTDVYQETSAVLINTIFQSVIKLTYFRSYRIKNIYMRKHAFVQIALIFGGEPEKEVVFYGAIFMSWL